MDKEKEIEEMTKVLETSCIGTLLSKSISEYLVNRGFGDIKRAKKELLENLKDSFFSSTKENGRSPSDVYAILAQIEKVIKNL